MKKIIPFEKEISFENNIGSINSISLEYDVKTKENNVVAGTFYVSGDYLADSSNNLSKFDYKLPFNINVDKKYEIKDAVVDINNFYYEVINNKVLVVNIELSIDNIVEKEKDEVIDILEEERCVEEEDIKVKLFDELDENETYVTYKIHVVTENDTVETIINDYNITKEKLADYNDLSDVKIGDKIIIPNV